MAKKKTVGKVYHQTSIRWEAHEFEEIKQLASKAKLNVTQYIRMRALKITASEAAKPVGNPGIAELAQAGGLAWARKRSEMTETDDN